MLPAERLNTAMLWCLESFGCQFGLTSGIKYLQQTASHAWIKAALWPVKDTLVVVLTAGPEDGCLFNQGAVIYYLLGALSPLVCAVLNNCVYIRNV